MNDLEFRKEVLDKISPSFCAAKWYNATIWLGSGMTTSCHHPPAHLVDKDKVSINSRLLHNTDQKKEDRRKMLAGERPPGCEYCWKIEDMGRDAVSDRVYKSKIYPIEALHEARNTPSDKDVNLRTLEIAFDRTCQFACSYCNPGFSTTWANDIKRNGPYNNLISDGRNHFTHDHSSSQQFKITERNPYIDAFFAWWESDLHKTLRELRITGGEPLMHVSTWRLFDSLKQDPLPDLELNINSNLGSKADMVDRLVDNINHLNDNQCIKRFKLFTSIDTWGSRAEYIRTGLDLKLWERNFHAYLSKTKSPITFMITFNILSVTTFRSLLEKILEWRSLYRYKNSSERRIRFDTPYLKEPLQYDINILPKREFMPYMNDSLAFIEENMDDDDNTKFTKEEFEKFRRVVHYMEHTTYHPDKVAEGRKDFFNWFNTLDQRRNTDFKKAFPEMKKFYRQCGIVNG